MPTHDRQQGSVGRSAPQIMLWLAVAALGAVSLAVLALHRGESVNALWLVVAAICVYAIAYRFYSLFLARRVTGLDAARPTPAITHNDGLDYVPTNRFVLFGHHFAAIAGAGPLIGPVLAAQMGYLPATLWILVGVVFAGAVQDFLILFLSVRRDGRSLGDMIRTEMGAFAGIVASVGILAIMVILLAVLGLVVVKALAGSPWGSFAVFATIPIALVMGVYGRFVRPGRVLEMSLIGFFRPDGRTLVWRRRRERPGDGALVHLFRHHLGADARGIRVRGQRAAGLADPGPARLPEHVPQDWHDLCAGDRHCHRDAGAAYAGGQPVHRRHRAGVRRQRVSVPVHHHRLRVGQRLSRAGFQRHHAEDAGKTKFRPG